MDGIVLSIWPSKSYPNAKDKRKQKRKENEQKSRLAEFGSLWVDQGRARVTGRAEENDGESCFWLGLEKAPTGLKDLIVTHFLFIFLTRYMDLKCRVESKLHFDYFFKFLSPSKEWHLTSLKRVHRRGGSVGMRPTRDLTRGERKRRRQRRRHQFKPKRQVQWRLIQSKQSHRNDDSIF